MCNESCLSFYERNTHTNCITDHIVMVAVAWGVVWKSRWNRENVAIDFYWQDGGRL